MQCVILAGGLSTRMRPLTENIPKSLLPVAGHPFVRYQLDWLQSHGVTEVVLCTGYRGEMIQEYIGDGSSWNLRARYVDEGKDLRGTGGALRLALEKGVLAESFLVTYGDSFLPIDFGAVYVHFLASSEPALMTVYRNRGKWDSSNVCFGLGKVSLYEKNRPDADRIGMDFIDYGLLAFRRSIIETAIRPGVKEDLAAILHTLSTRGLLGGFEVSTRFYEIGSFEGLADFTRFAEESLALSQAPAKPSQMTMDEASRVIR